MINTIRAKKIASEWHGGHWSALYQFASTGIFSIENCLRYFHELETCLHPEYNIHPGILSKKSERELNSLKKFLFMEAKNKGLTVNFRAHGVYGYLIPYLTNNVPDEIAEQVTALTYPV